jgi:hypothetical protein
MSGAETTGGRNVLVVSTSEDVSDAVAPYLHEKDNVKVIVPVVGQGFLDWLSNDEKAFAKAEAAAGDVADALPAETVDARAGESDIDLAIHDALATFPADEIIVAVSGNGDVVDAIVTDDDRSGRRIDGVPVRVVTTR